MKTLSPVRAVMCQVGIKLYILIQ